MAGLPDSHKSRSNLEALTKPLDSVPADQQATDDEEGFVNIVTLFIAHSQPTLLEEPREDAFHDAAVFPQSTAVFGVTFRNEWFDAALSQGAADFLFGIVSAIREGLIRSAATASAGALDRWDGVDQRDRLLGVMHVRAGLNQRQGRPLAITGDMTFRTVLPAIRGIGASLLPPKSARTEQLSKITLDQSMASAKPSSSSNTRHTCCQTPATCQSRSRRQQVIPLPHPSSGGSNSQAHPVRATNRMPVSACRSGTRGRPPFGFGGSSGKSGSMRFHNSSVSSGLAISCSSMNDRRITKPTTLTKDGFC